MRSYSVDVDEDSYRIKAIRAAQDLHYKSDVIERIRHAKTDAEIERIMISARRGEI